MISIVGIRFQQDGKMLYYASGEFRPHVGEYVIAETAHGSDLAGVTERSGFDLLYIRHIFDIYIHMSYAIRISTNPSTSGSKF